MSHVPRPGGPCRRYGCRGRLKWRTGTFVHRPDDEPFEAMVLVCNCGTEHNSPGSRIGRWR